MAANPVATGATSDGESRAIAREKKTTESAEASEEPTMIGGSAVGGKFERKSASRAAFAATCCVMRRKAVSVAARTTGRVWSSRPASRILTSGARRPKDTTQLEDLAEGEVDPTAIGLEALVEGNPEVEAQDSHRRDVAKAEARAPVRVRRRRVPELADEDRPVAEEDPVHGAQDREAQLLVQDDERGR